MVLVMIVCETGIEARVLDGLRTVGVPGYTRLPNATGDGRTGRRDGDPIWPGTNTVLLVAVDDDALLPMRDLLARLKDEYFRPPALHAFTLSANELI